MDPANNIPIFNCEYNNDDFDIDNELTFLKITLKILINEYSM